MTTPIASSLYPDRWRTLRSRFVLRLNPSKRQVAGRSIETPVSFVPMEAIGEWGGLDASASRSLGDVQTGYTFFRDGDVLVAKITPCFENGKGALAKGLVDGFGFGTTELHVMSPSRVLDSKFLFYVTISHPFRLLGQGEMFGAGGQKRIPESFLLDFPIGLPSIPEQVAIASYLDRKTTAIDALISKKERQIELLQEKRQALLTQAVTKGTDSTIPMKDSGVGWIGRVPSHWKVKRVKFLCRLESGHTPSKTEPAYWVGEECVIPWVSLNDTKRLEADDYIDDTAVKISASGMANSSAHMIPAGAVVFNRDGARVGLAAITTRPMAVSQHIIAWVCGPDISNTYLLHAIYAMQDELVRLTTGATIPTIGMTDVRELTVPVPPLDEQLRIVPQLISVRHRLATAMETVAHQVRLLLEYRQAVITNAVTGKTDLSKEAA